MGRLDGPRPDRDRELRNARTKQLKASQRPKLHPRRSTIKPDMTLTKSRPSAAAEGRCPPGTICDYHRRERNDFSEVRRCRAQENPTPSCTMRAAPHETQPADDRSARDGSLSLSRSVITRKVFAGWLPIVDPNIFMAIRCWDSILQWSRASPPRLALALLDYARLCLCHPSHIRGGGDHPASNGGISMAKLDKPRPTTFSDFVDVREGTDACARLYPSAGRISISRRLCGAES